MKQNRFLLALLVFGIAISFISTNPSLATVSDVPDGYFELYIYQQNHGAVGETKVMGFDVSSYFNVSMDVNISLIIMTPSDLLVTIYSGPAFIPAWGLFYDEASYTFDEKGHYEVTLFVYDGFGREWTDNCWWEINDPYLDLWISQDNYASVGETGYMAIDVESHFSMHMNVTVKVAIVTPNGTEFIIYQDFLVALVPFDYWYDDVYYTFTESGFYDVIFSVSGEFGYWETRCWWEVYETSEYLALWIYQDFHRNVNETGWMDFVVENRFNRNITVDIEVKLMGPSGDIIIHPFVTIDMMANETWFFYTEYLFTEPGYYDVLLTVIEQPTGQVWEFWCWWEIGDQGPNGYELFIDQDYNAKVGETKWMHFKAQSYFDHDMPNVVIKIRMEDPTGYTEMMLEIDVPINAHGVWEIDLNYTFTQVGMYTVHFSLYDDIMHEWYTKCKWDVTQAGPEIFIDVPGSVDVNETFTVKATVSSGPREELHVKKILITWENGTILEVIDVNETFPPESFFDVHFNITIPVKGEFLLRVKADTNKGLLETKFSVRVGLPDDKTESENKETTPTLTPGFESVFGLLALLIAIPLIRKSRR